jgi:endonuclease YncB( thermonuclease family)
MIIWPDHTTIKSPPFKGEHITGKVVKVYDGDTCTVIMPIQDTFFKINIRVNGIDTPEISHRGSTTDIEVSAGLKVRDKVRDMILDKIVIIDIIKWDKYGGRVVANIEIEGVSLSNYLLENKLAKAYDGGTKTAWTSEELSIINNL